MAQMERKEAVPQKKPRGGGGCFSANPPTDLIEAEETQDAGGTIPGPKKEEAIKKEKAEPVNLKGRMPNHNDTCAMPEHFYHVFETWPVIRPGVKEFLGKIAAAKKKGDVKRVFIYTANTSLPWVRFVMQCLLKYCGFGLDLIDGIKHAPGGLKVVPANAVLYDDHSGNAIGNCVQVSPYTNEIPWVLLEPMIQALPDHGAETCPCWDQCGGLQAFINRDKSYKDRDHDPESDNTLIQLTKDFVPHEEVLLDMDETLIAGARISAYFNALNHFLMFREETQQPASTTQTSES